MDHPTVIVSVLFLSLPPSFPLLLPHQSLSYFLLVKCLAIFQTWVFNCLLFAYFKVLKPNPCVSEEHTFPESWLQGPPTASYLFLLTRHSLWWQAAWHRQQVLNPQRKKSDSWNSMIMCFSWKSHLPSISIPCLICHIYVSYNLFWSLCWLSQSEGRNCIHFCTRVCLFLFEWAFSPTGLIFHGGWWFPFILLFPCTEENQKVLNIFWMGET